MSRALENVRQNLREFNVLAYGAVPTTGTDSTTAIKNAISALTAVGGGTLFFPPGAYKVTEPLACTAPMTLKGANCRSTILQINHVAGPGITFGDYFSGVEDMQIQGSSARLVAENTADVGIRFQPSGSRALFSHWVRRCLITNQGGSSIEGLNVAFLVIEDTRIIDGGGHGVYFDATTVDATNARTGIIEIKNSQIEDMRGHAVCGGLTNYVYRLVMDNVDCGPCAQTADIRQSAYNSHIVGQNVFIRSSAFAGHDGGSPRTATIGGLYLDGRNPLVEQCRFIDVLNTAIELGNESDGARLLDNQITGDVQVALDPAYVVGASCVGVYARCGFPANFDSVMTVAPNNTGNRSETYSVSPQGYKSSISSITIADDAIHTFTFTGVVWGMLALSCNSTGGKNALVAFRVGDGSAYVTLLGGDAADITVGTGVLAGTTGTDARLNISASTSTNVLYIENRQGASYSWMPTFMSLSGGELVL